MVCRLAGRTVGGLFGTLGRHFLCQLNWVSHCHTFFTQGKQVGGPKAQNTKQSACQKFHKSFIPLCMLGCRWWRHQRRSKHSWRPSVQHDTYWARLCFGTPSTCQRAISEKKRGCGTVPHLKPGQITYCHWHNRKKSGWIQIPWVSSCQVCEGAGPWEDEMCCIM